MTEPCQHQTVLRELHSVNTRTGAKKFQYVCKACRANLGHEPCGQFASYGVPVTPITAAYFDHLNDGVVVGVDLSRGRLPHESDFGLLTEDRLQAAMETEIGRRIATGRGRPLGTFPGLDEIRAGAKTMPEPGDEDTSDMDREMIAKDLEVVAKSASRLGYPDMATEIGALVAKYRKAADTQD